MEASSEPGTNPWREYIEGEIEILMRNAGPELCLAMIHSRAIECPEHYYKSRSYDKDLSKAHFGITKAGYWERIALRALVLLQVPIEEREKLIAESLERERQARAAVSKRVKQGPGGTYREVDLTKLQL